MIFIAGSVGVSEKAEPRQHAGTSEVLLSAFWEDLKISVNHPSDFEKVAIVSSNNIKDIYNKPITPLIHSEVKIFDKSQRAKQWILNS